MILMINVWIYICFAKGTSVKLYKHCANLQEATKFMVLTPTTFAWAPGFTVLSGPEDSKKNSRHPILIISQGNWDKCETEPWEQTNKAKLNK